MTQMVRVHNLVVSSDGYAAGEGQCLERPFGRADPWASSPSPPPTTFHFVGGDPAGVLERALDAADGKDVRLGGGANTVRQFLDAGLVDTLQVAVSPVELGGGSRLWESPDELLDRYHRDVVPSPGGDVVQHLFWRR